NGKPVIYDMFKRGGRNIYASGVLYIFYSSDLGLHWDNVSETGMPNQYIYRVIQGDSALYAGTYGNSIWKRDYLKLTNCSSTKYNVSNDNISNIPYNTTIDTLISNLQLAHGATAYVENMAKSG